MNIVQTYYYWEDFIRKNTIEDILFASDKQIQKDSVFIYIGIMDRQKNIFEAGWMSQPSAQNALGYLQHIFLPTCFYTWVDKVSQGLYVPQSTFATLEREVLATLSETIDGQNLHDAWVMEDHYECIASLWDEPDNYIVDKLKVFSDLFTGTWDQDPHKKLFLKVFASTAEIYDFLLASMDDVFEEVIEDDLQMLSDQFKFMCDNAYKEPLMNKNFIKILNSRVPICF